MNEPTAEVKRLREQIADMARNARTVQATYPDCTGSWWQIENASLPAMQYMADQVGQKLDWDADKGRFRMHSHDYRCMMTLFIYSTPVKARMIYEPMEVGHALP